MGRSAGTKEYKTFVGGLFTEANALTYPENASIDEQNFILNTDGSRERRLGFDIETDGVYTNTGLSASLTSERKTISTFIWNNIANNPNKIILVVQYGLNLYFYDISEDSKTISDSYINSISLTKRVGGSQGEEHISFTSGNGILIVTGGDIEPQYITFEEPNVFNKNLINIKIRDFWGVKNTSTYPYYATPNVDTRPAKLNNLHKYNLYNQGWSQKRIDDFKGSTDSILAYLLITIGEMVTGHPSNADIMYHGNYTDVGNGRTAWSASEIGKMQLGSTPAPKGKYVISAFNRSQDREDNSNISGLTLDKELGRPSEACYHSSRVFYSGIQSELEGTEQNTPNFSGIIFFSPILTDLNKIGSCYQEADPTSQDISDLVATDGGTILLPEANKILKLESVGSSIFVVADNGIWEIKSGEAGFAPDDYIISKVSNIGAYGRDSVITTEMGVIYWSDTGIYIITQHEVTGDFHSQNISEQSIQTFFDDIPNQNKKNAKGFYDPTTKTVRWLYNSDPSTDGINFKNKYNSELILNIKLKAFYRNTISDGTPYIASIFNTPPFSTYSSFENVTDEGEEVLDDSELVTDSISGVFGGVVTSKYLIIKPIYNYSTHSTGTILTDPVGDSLTTEAGNQIQVEQPIGNQWNISFGEFNNLDFVDWDQENFVSYLVTGYDIFGKVSSKKQVSYMTMFFNYLENSSCKIRQRWDFSDHEDSGKWGEEFEAYRLKGLVLDDPNFNYGYSVVPSKNKLRGSGKALSLHISSSEGKPMHLLGWSIDAQGTTI